MRVRCGDYAGQEHIECCVSRNDVVVGVAGGGRELPQRTLHELRLDHRSARAGQDGQLIQQLIGWLAQATIGLV